MIRLHIDRLFWDDWNRDHVSKHGIEPEDAEAVIAADPVVKATYKSRFQLLGSTLTGQVLSVVVGAAQDQPGVYYVFSARPASRGKRREMSVGPATLVRMWIKEHLRREAS